MIPCEKRARGGDTVGCLTWLESWNAFASVNGPETFLFSSLPSSPLLSPGSLVPSVCSWMDVGWLLLEFLFLFLLLLMSSFDRCVSCCEDSSRPPFRRSQSERISHPVSPPVQRQLPVRKNDSSFSPPCSLCSRFDEREVEENCLS